jgi:putative ABC transport system permease protein
MAWLIIGLFVAVYIGIGAIAMRRRLLARLAIREAVRRPLQSLLLVAGLMVGAAGIFGMQVVVDSSVESFGATAAQAWGRVDLTASQGGRPFSADVAESLRRDPGLPREIAGVQGGLELIGSALDLDRKIGKPGVRLVGFDPGAQGPFGDYVLEDGRRTQGQDLGEGGVILSRSLAGQLDAHVGDRLRLAIGPRSADVIVAGVARPEGPGTYGRRPAVYAPLDALSTLAGPGLINVVRLTAHGSGQAELDAAHAAAAPLRAELARNPAASALVVREAKAEDIQTARDGQDHGRGFFTAFSLIVALSGVALVVNLTLALAEERRPRLGVLRALGLTRAGLVTVSVIEGALYSLVAAVAGLLPGMLIALLLVNQLGAAVSSFTNREAAVVLGVHPESLLVSVAAGALITLATLFGASIRTSRMAVSSAIRDLPEPAPQGASELARRGMLVALAAGGVVAMLAGGIPGRILGGCSLIVLAAALARGRLPDRLRLGAMGASLAAWALVNAPTLGPTTDASGAGLFIALVAAVFGLSITAAAGLRLVEAVPSLLPGGRGRIQATLRPPLAYLSRRPVRAGLGTGTFALVLTVITGLSAFGATFASSISSGTYDLRVSSAKPVELPASVRPAIARQLRLDTRTYLGPVRNRQISGSENTNPEQLMVLYSMADADMRVGTLEFVNRDPRFHSDADVWRALRDEPGWVISPNYTNPGAILTLQGADGPVSFHVAGAIPDPALWGLIGSDRTFAGFGAAPTGSALLLRTAPGHNPAAVAREIQRALYDQGTDTVLTTDLIATLMIGFRAFLGSIQLLMLIGLTIGVATLGILALRAVVERRRAIGVLRALGYQPRAILGGVVTEGVLTLTTGVLVGLAAGLAFSQVSLRQVTAEGSLHADWQLLAAAILGVYATVLVVTIGPALRASRLAPSEALRVVG